MHIAVGLDVTVTGLGKSVYDCHKIRNDMQHNNPAATVDSQHCYVGAKAALPDKLKVMLRVVRLFSRHGDPRHQTEFGDAMQTHHWRGNRERARQGEVIIPPGPRANWGLVIPSEYARVEALLDGVGVPPF